MSDYVRQAVEHYKGKAGISELKRAATPYCPPGSLLPSDDDVRGELVSESCSILMKDLWAARLARPDLARGVCRLASRITKWSKNDDKKVKRLME